MAEGPSPSERGELRAVVYLMTEACPDTEQPKLRPTSYHPSPDSKMPAK